MRIECKKNRTKWCINEYLIPHTKNDRTSRHTCDITRTLTRENPYPWCWVRVLMGQGMGWPRDTPGLPVVFPRYFEVLWRKVLQSHSSTSCIHLLLVFGSPVTWPEKDRNRTGPWPIRTANNQDRWRPQTAVRSTVLCKFEKFKTKQRPD